MRAYKLAEMEANFAKTLTDSYGKKWKATAGQYGTTLLYGAGTGFFYADPTKKTTILLHSTAGVLHGDIGELTKPNNHVSVHFVVARSGVIYQLFDTKNWSYHLGSGATGTNTVMSKTSVAIEMSNIGPLKLSGDVLSDAYGKPYCAKADNQYYTKATYRGNDYFATYTETQIASVATLLKNISAAHSIPLTFLPADKQHDFYKQLPTAKVLYHTNLRSDKSDPGPAFDHRRLKIS